MSRGNSRRSESRRAELPADSFENAQLPPHNIEAEQGVVGCCLLDTRGALGLAIERIGAKEVFYDLRHQAVYEAMRGMVDAGKFVDAITLGDRLRNMPARMEGETTDCLEGVGGMPYLAGLMNLVPSAASIEYYLEIVLEKWRLRRMVRTLAECSARIWSHAGTVQELLGSIESDVLAAGADLASGGMKPMREITHRALEEVETCFHRGKGIIAGVATGYSYFDKMAGGLHKKEMIVIGARPSVGKTALMLGIAKHVARVQKRKVAIFSMEMSDTSLCLRLWCDIAGVNMQQLRTGFATERDLQKLASTAGKLAELGIFIDDSGSLDVATLRARARRMVRQEGCEVVMLDYLQLARNPAYRQDRRLEVDSISMEIKAMAKELDVPVLVLAQLNREAAKNRNHKPTLADLRESGQIEQDADLVGLLYRVGADEEEEGGADKNVIEVNLLIAKQRNGPTGDCEFLFNREFMRFEDKYAGMGTREGELVAREKVKGVDFKKALEAKKAKLTQAEMEEATRDWPAVNPPPQD